VYLTPTWRRRFARFNNRVTSPAAQVGQLVRQRRRRRLLAELGEIASPALFCISLFSIGITACGTNTLFMPVAACRGIINYPAWIGGRMASLWKKRARRLRVCVSRRIRGQNNFRNNFISVHGVLTGAGECRDPQRRKRRKPRKRETQRFRLTRRLCQTDRWRIAMIYETYQSRWISEDLVTATSGSERGTRWRIRFRRAQRRVLCL